MNPQKWVYGFKSEPTANRSAPRRGTSSLYGHKKLRLEKDKVAPAKYSLCKRKICVTIYSMSKIMKGELLCLMNYLV